MVCASKIRLRELSLQRSIGDGSLCACARVCDDDVSARSSMRCETRQRHVVNLIKKGFKVCRRRRPVRSSSVPIEFPCMCIGYRRTHT